MSDTDAERADLVAKVWNMAHVLREDGVGYGDYVEQITYLLFLKMDEERARRSASPPSCLTARAGRTWRRSTARRCRRTTATRWSGCRVSRA